MPADTLVFAWGNPSRGDDALGPLFASALETLCLPGVECLTDFQLQVEHALDLVGRKRVLFVDASLDAPAPFTVERLSPARDDSFSSHAMSPRAVLQVFVDVQGETPPPAWQLAIRGERWALGEVPSDAALQALDQALAWARDWLGAGNERRAAGSPGADTPL
jgi:hydrogenase maturation protease